MFQRALPEVNGFGVTTCDARLDQVGPVVMCFGLPLRTMITATESVTKPLFWLQSQETTGRRPAFHVRLEGELHDVGGQAVSTARSGRRTVRRSC